MSALYKFALFGISTTLACFLHKKDASKIFSAHSYFRRLLFQYVSFNYSKVIVLHYFLATYPGIVNTMHVAIMVCKLKDF